MNAGRVAVALVAMALALSPVAAHAQTDGPCEVTCAPLAVVLVGGYGTDLDGATDQFADIRKAGRPQSRGCDRPDVVRKDYPVTKSLSSIGVSHTAVLRAAAAELASALSP